MNINKIIKEQEDFCKSTVLTLILLQAYKNNPKEFFLLFSKKINEDYFYNVSTDEYLWESLDELASDIANKSKAFTIKANGIFSVLHYAQPKKKKCSIEEIIENFHTFAEREWEI